MKTDEIRQNLILQLQEMLEITRKNSRQAKKPRETQCTNTLIRDLDIDTLKEEMEKFKEQDRIREEKEKAERLEQQSGGYGNITWAKPTNQNENQDTLSKDQHHP